MHTGIVIVVVQEWKDSKGVHRVKKKIKICGLPFKIKQINVINEGDAGITQGEIYCSQGEIRICKRLPKRIKKRVLYHEILHGILIQLGYDDLSSDEQFVQSMSNAIYQMFKLKK